MLLGLAAATNPVTVTLSRAGDAQTGNGGAQSGSDAQTGNGIAGTRRGNAPAWLIFVGPRTDGRPTVPTGDWTLTLHADAATLIDSGGITDVLLAVGGLGNGPAWPA